MKVFAEWKHTSVGNVTFYRSCTVLVAVYFIVTVCSECDPNCEECKDLTCYRCHSGYFLNRTGMCQKCPTNCHRCFNETHCEICTRGKGLFLNPDGQCEPCAENCFRCANEDQCLVCRIQFALESGKCKMCPDNCNVCDKNDDCSLCNKGFYVKNGTCESCNPMCLSCLRYEYCTECISGSWGQVCNDTCWHVNNNMSKCKDENCNQETGECIECEEGAFGSYCENTCPNNCRDGICDKNGHCSQGCQQGFYGDTCNNTCPKSCEQSICDRHGHCSEGYQKGFYGDTCNKTCMSGSTLRDNICCPENCLNCTENGRCFACDDGFFGDTCNRSCMETCKTCSSSEKCTECGLHRYDSKSDLEADLCLCDEQECKVYANVEVCRQCKQPAWYTHMRGCCPCPEHCKSDCEQFSGHCKDGCQKGWFGPHCDNRCAIRHCVICRNYDICKKCENEYFGQICQFNCSLECLQSSVGPLCDMETGHCFHGCKNGTWGKTCNHSCSYNCVDGSCNRRTGYCLKCHSTYYGLYCEKEDHSKQLEPNTIVPIIVVCIASCTVLFAVVVTVVMVNRKRFCPGNRDSDMNNANFDLDETNTQNALVTNPGSSVEVADPLASNYENLALNDPETNTQNALVTNPGSSVEVADPLASNYESLALNDPETNIYDALLTKPGSIEVAGLLASNYENLALNDHETNTQNASEATPRSSGEGAGLKASNYENIPPNNPDAVHVRQLRTATGLETGNKVSLGHGSGMGEFE